MGCGSPVDVALPCSRRARYTLFTVLTFRANYYDRVCVHVLLWMSRGSNPYGEQPPAAAARIEGTGVQAAKEQYHRQMGRGGVKG